MTATTADTTASKVKDGAKAIEDYLFPLLEDKRTIGLIVPIAYKTTVPTTSLDDVADILRLTPKLPAGYVHDFRGTPSDLDTHATPTLVYSVVAVDGSDNVLFTLAASSDKGQAASGSDRISDASAHKYASTDFYIALKIVTVAATPAAGTYAWSMTYSQGILKPTATATGPFLGANAEA